MKAVPRYKNLSLLPLLLMAVTPYLHASPTENEFVRCKKIAVKILASCLDEKAHYRNEKCWPLSQNSYSRCKQGVVDSHSTEKIDAQKKRRIEAEKRRKQEAEEN